ncbi:MAG: hypothetical protein ACI8TP_002779 [Acidimicrobiales bacterium]
MANDSILTSLSEHERHHCQHRNTSENNDREDEPEARPQNDRRTHCDDDTKNQQIDDLLSFRLFRDHESSVWNHQMLLRPERRSDRTLSLKHHYCRTLDAGQECVVSPMAIRRRFRFQLADSSSRSRPSNIATTPTHAVTR